MFNRSIRKIVLVVMGALILVLGLTILSVYLVSYSNVKKENEMRLERYANEYIVSEDYIGPGMEFRPDMQGPVGPRRPMDMASTFYSVLFDSDGNVIKTDINSNFIYQESDILEFANIVINKNKAYSSHESLSYVVSLKGEYTLVVFMDNTITDNNFNVFLRVALIVGAIMIFISFFVSIFLAKRIVKPLEENDKRQKQFVSDAGHELKTPVSVINANAEILLRNIGQNEWLDNILYENERMGLLVKELLDLNRVENMEANFSNLNLTHIVNGEILPFDALAYENGITIEASIEDNIEIKGNENELKQLVSILLDNAIKYTKGGNVINVNLVKEGKSIILSVENYADKIENDKIDHLFERFYRLDEARTNQDNHYGLGLAIAKAICDKHNAKITASSKDNKVIFKIIF